MIHTCAVDMKSLPGVTFIQGDFLEDFARQEIARVLSGKRADVMLSDMAPNCTYFLLFLCVCVCVCMCVCVYGHTMSGNRIVGVHTSAHTHT